MYHAHGVSPVGDSLSTCNSRARHAPRLFCFGAGSGVAAARSGKREQHERAERCGERACQVSAVLADQHAADDCRAEPRAAHQRAQVEDAYAAARAALGLGVRVGRKVQTPRLRATPADRALAPQQPAHTPGPGAHNARRVTQHIDPAHTRRQPAPNVAIAADGITVEDARGVRRHEHRAHVTVANESAPHVADPAPASGSERVRRQSRRPCIERARRPRRACARAPCTRQLLLPRVRAVVGWFAVSDDAQSLWE